MSLRTDKKGRLRAIAPYCGAPALAYWELTDRAVLAAVFHDFWCQVAIAALLQLILYDLWPGMKLEEVEL